MVAGEISKILFAESSKHRYFRADKKDGNSTFIKLDEDGYDPRIMKTLEKVGLERIVNIVPLSASEFELEFEREIGFEV